MKTQHLQTYNKKPLKHLPFDKRSSHSRHPDVVMSGSLGRRDEKPSFSVLGFSHTFYGKTHDPAGRGNLFFWRRVPCLPSHPSRLHSQSHGHRATPRAHTLRCPGTSPPPTDTAAARPQSSRPHPSGPGSLGSRRSAESARCIGRSRTEILRRCTSPELENKALGKKSARCGSHLRARGAV